MSDVSPEPGVDRRRVLQYGGALSAFGVMAPALAACSGGPDSTSDTGGGGGGDSVTAVIGYGNDQSWDPTLTASAFSVAANHHIFEGLLDTDPITREPYPALATELPADTGAGTWSFTLRSGATWHDGKPVTADDVVFTFDRILDTETQTLAHGFFAGWLKEVKKTGDDTVDLVLAFPFPDGLSRLTLAKILPKHILGKSGAWKDLDTGLPEVTVGSGPYRMTANQPLSNTSFEAYADYNGPRKANFKKMNWLSIVDAAPRVAKISGGSAGAQISDNIPYANVKQLEQDGLTVEGGAGMNHMFLLFNTERAPFDDVRVRQALHYAIDTDKMIEAGLKGYGKAASSFLDEGNPTYRKAKTVYGHDPDKAKALLEDAGVSGLKVTLMASTVSWIADCIPTIKESWDAIGVETTLEPQETSALFTKLDQKANYQVVASASNPNQLGIDADLILRYNYTAENVWMDYARWSQASEAKQLFRLMDAATREPDQEKKKQMTQEYLDVIAENAVIYPVVHTELVTAWDDGKITGIQPQPYPGINLLKAKPA
ncbi:ABC transporter substrate-binding protein [Streptomyces sp. CNQ-509]|uniref:ABC transporter substrate-binding protein n=1 Tax=unclassified Streptomyces TaxID=2593676 RepID=UPI00062DEF99|nr:ABC transporter substrate-binding protein [Streptomyces sp. CNQ-509]AKH81568.1 ABC transporter substrate-binding protein [Streptomyces sp. CNQ-509]